MSEAILDGIKVVELATYIAGPASGVPLHRPVSLASRTSTELWIANMDNDSVTIVNLAEVDGSFLSAEERKDTLAYHYMTHMSGISFNRNGTEFATCQDSTNRYGQAEAWDAVQDWRWKNQNNTDFAAEAAEGKAGNNFIQSCKFEHAVRCCRQWVPNAMQNASSHREHDD